MACHTKTIANKLKDDESTIFKAPRLLGPSVESKFDELKYEVINKIDKELTDSQNARDYISQKYDELCNKIQYLTELDATVTGFRSDVKAIEKQITELSLRVDDIEKRTICRECPSLTSSMY
uniref:SFRICE_012457 n=1 Tax=Spodoptera frugiperda TaxID=7108 RepID=A0A2H1VB71_SPOFR